jgi:pimeloyl-ACP methyl ester carboxylesterase
LSASSQVAYRQVGSGPTLVLLHGAFADGRVWTRQLEDLSDEVTVIALDAPGFGASDDPPPTWTSANYPPFRHVAYPA